MNNSVYALPVYIEGERSSQIDEEVHAVPVAKYKGIYKQQTLEQLATCINSTPSQLSQLIGEQPQLSPVIIDKLPPLTRAMAKMGGLRGKSRSIVNSPGNSTSRKRKHGSSDLPGKGLTPQSAKLEGKDMTTSTSFQSPQDLQRVARNYTNEELDECPPRVLTYSPQQEQVQNQSNYTTYTTNEAIIAENVEKYSNMIGDLIDKLNQRQETSFSAEDEHISDYFTHSEAKKLLKDCKLMAKYRLIDKLDVDLVLSLMTMLDKQVQIGAEIDVLGTNQLDSNDPEWDASGINARLILRLQTSLDIGICMEIIMSAPEVDRRVLAEENIDNCMQLFKHVVHRLILPALDPTFAITSSSSDNAPEDERIDDDTVGTPVKNKHRISKSGGNKSYATNIKNSKELRKAVEKLVPYVNDFMQHLSLIILTFKLADRWILHFSSSMMSFFVLEHNNIVFILQESSAMVLRAIFQQYPAHRSLLLEELVNVMLKLPTSKRNLRNLKLVSISGQVSGNIQMISSLVVTLIQSGAYNNHKTEKSSSKSKGEANNIRQRNQLEELDGVSQSFEEDELNSAANAVLSHVRDATRIFVGALMKECMKKHEERDNRAILENFIEDLLLMFVRIEYPGAEIVLEVISSSLASILSANLNKKTSLESSVSLMALNLVGKICASIKGYEKLATEELYLAEESYKDQDKSEWGTLSSEHQYFLLQKERQLAEAKILVSQEGGNLHQPSQSTGKLTRRVLMQHIVLTYLLHKNDSDSIKGMEELFLARFVENSSLSFMTSIWNEYLELISKNPDQRQAYSKLHAPSQDLVFRLCVHLAVSRDFCGLFEKLLAHLMVLLSRGQPTFRARVMKALASIVDVDPMLMADRNVRTAVSRCFLDEGTSVRQAAVDLVGKYISLQPLLFDQYFDMLVERLRDKGVSVRRSVCKIFRSYLTTNFLSSDETGNNIKNGTSDKKHDEIDGRLLRKAQCMRFLVDRVGDPAEEIFMKTFIIDTFQEVWFGSDLSSVQLNHSSAPAFGDELPPGWYAKIIEDDPTALAENTPPPTKKRKNRQSVGGPKSYFFSPDGKFMCDSREEAWTVYGQQGPQQHSEDHSTPTSSITPASVLKGKRSGVEEGITSEIVVMMVQVVHDMGNNSQEWFVDLLKRLMNPTYSKDSKTTKNACKLQDAIKSAKSRADRIVRCVMECLLQLEEGKKIQGLVLAIGEEKESFQIQFLSCLKTLLAFSAASPNLLLEHVDLLLVYLKDTIPVSNSQDASGVEHSEDDSESKWTKANEIKRQSIVVSILFDIIAEMNATRRNLPLRILNQLEGDLKHLILRAPPSVVQPSIKCLGALSYTANSSKELLMKLFGAFNGYLFKCQNRKSFENLPADITSSLQRALFAAGQIAGATTLKQDNETKLYDFYRDFLKKSGTSACLTKAVQGLGFMMMANPRLLLTAQQDLLLDFILAKTIHIEVKLQTLTSLKELLKAEEQRLEKGHSKKKINAKKTKNEQVQGDQEAEAALIGSVMQAQLNNILLLSLEKQMRVRSEALGCMSLLLTQGLVSPLPCIPNLVALEADHVIGIRDAAHAQLLEINEKFPTVINTPAIQGIFISHSFQLRAFGKCQVSLLERDKKTKYCVYGRLYTNCIRNSGRQARHLFLQALVNQFADKGNILSSSNTRKKPMKTMDYLCYVAQLLSSLPYDLEDEPLFVIYLLNRYVSLKLPPIMGELKMIFITAGLRSDIFKRAEEAEINLSDIDIFTAVTFGDTNMSQEQIEDLQATICVSFALCLLIRLKFFLKEMYLLDNEKCQMYQPSQAIKAIDQQIYRCDGAPNMQLELPTADELQAESVPHLTWNIFILLWKAVQEDQHQMDFEATDEAKVKVTARKKKANKRRKPQNSKQKDKVQKEKLAEGEDEEDLDEDFYMEEAEEFVEGFD